MKRKTVNFISFCLVVIMSFSMFLLPAQALRNGVGKIKDNNGNTLGNWTIWNNSSDYYTMYTQSESQIGHVNYISAQSLAKTLSRNNYVFYDGDIEYNTNAEFSPIATLVIPSEDLPLLARGIFEINSNSVGACYTYNLGEGCSICDCCFWDDLIND